MSVKAEEDKNSSCAARSNGVIGMATGCCKRKA